MTIYDLRLYVNLFNIKSLKTILFLILILISNYSFSLIYSYSSNDNFVIGKNKKILISKRSVVSLEHIAQSYQMGLSNLLEANPKIDVYLPKNELLVPQKLLLPNSVRHGIVVNSAEMRLYYFIPKTNKVAVFPIGIGDINNITPKNWITKIHRKQQSPIWIPTKKIHEEYKSMGKILPSVVPSGKNNPMGLYALYIENLFAIHGTNKNFGVGLRTSHGCLRLRTENIKWLFNNVPIGTQVLFINQPVKASIEPNGARYIEVHHPLSNTKEELVSHIPLPIILPANINKIINNKSVNKKILHDALNKRYGIPIKLND